MKSPIGPSPTILRKAITCAASGGCPERGALAQHRHQAERRADDDERHGGRHRAERVDLRRGHGGGQRLQLERQRVQLADRLRRAGDLVPGQREAEQADADQRRQR